MSTATILPPAANAIAVKNRLSRDLDDLTRAAAGAGTLPADDAGVSFDLACHLSEATKALTAAIADLDRYISAERAARLARANAAAAEFNAVVFGL